MFTEIGGGKTKKVARHTATLYNQKLYIFGGTCPNKDFLLPCKDFLTFDFKSKIWTREILDEIIELTGHTGCFYKDKIYYFGGNTLSGFSNLLFAYDLNDKTCKNVLLQNYIIKDRFGHVAVTIGDRMIVYGGLLFDFGWVFYSDSYEIDLNHMKVKEIKYENMLPDLARGSHAAISYNNKMITFGGLTDKGRLNSLYSLERVKDGVYKWEILPSKGKIPCQRAGSAMCEYNDIIYISGGFEGAKTLCDVYSYEIKTGYWKEIKIELLTKIRLHSMNVYHDENGTYLVVYGGVTEVDTDIKNELQILQIESNLMMKKIFLNRNYYDVHFVLLS